MSSKYGFKSDAERKREEEERRRREEAERQERRRREEAEREARERARKQAQEKRLTELASAFDRIDEKVSDILTDFAQASPSYFDLSDSARASPSYFDLSDFAQASPGYFDDVDWRLRAHFGNVESPSFEVVKIPGLAHFPPPRLDRQELGQPYLDRLSGLGVPPSLSVSGGARDYLLRRDPKRLIPQEDPDIPWAILDKMGIHPSPVDYGEEGEEVFHTWVIADSLVVMLVWVKGSGRPGLTLWTRTANIPESDLEQLRSVLERETGMPCTR